jgi:hypothetical protein
LSRGDDQRVQSRAHHLGAGASDPEAVLVEREVAFERVVRILEGLVTDDGVLGVVHPGLS